MIIRTLTCHDVYNYGASLQAFALQRYLHDQGHDVKIIDYKPNYLSFKYRLSWFINDKSPYYKKCNRNKFYHLLYIIKRYITDLKTIGRKYSFEKFNNKFLKLTNKYNSYIELCKTPPEADVYIVGSDQVWNNKPLDNGWDPAFFLNFGTSHVKRISYAASFGSTIECPWIMSKWMQCLNAISVRESKSLNLLQSYEIKGNVVCDPVFLLSKTDWYNQLELDFSGEPYVLVYNLSGNNNKLLNDAKQIAKKLNCEIHNIVVAHHIKGVTNIKNADPREFVKEIAGASFVLSDSFHATVFSIIFKKQFFSYIFKNMQASDRIYSLLDKFDMIQRFEPDIKAYTMPIDYDYNGKVSKTLRNYISESKFWLNKQLND